jgi:putative membrane protein
MTLVSNIAVGLVALLHAGFLVLEMFFWSRPLGRRVFGLPPEVVASSAPLAANQGLYNGFLAAGLVWGLWVGAEGYTIKVFFLACVAIAGIFGAATAKRSILWIQAVPAAVALVLVWLARP